MGYTTTLFQTVQSRESADGIPLQTTTLKKTVELPIPPQQNMWLQEESVFQHSKIETVAIHGQSILAYLFSVAVDESRVAEIVSRHKAEGWW